MVIKFQGTCNFLHIWYSCKARGTRTDAAITHAEDGEGALGRFLLRGFADPGNKLPGEAWAPRLSPKPFSPAASRTLQNSWASRQLGRLPEDPGNSVCGAGGVSLPLCATTPPSVKWADAHAALGLQHVSGAGAGAARPLLETIRKMGGRGLDHRRSVLTGRLLSC